MILGMRHNGLERRALRLQGGLRGDSAETSYGSSIKSSVCSIPVPSKRLPDTRGFQPHSSVLAPSWHPASSGISVAVVYVTYCHNCEAGARGWSCATRRCPRLCLSGVLGTSLKARGLPRRTPSLHPLQRELLRLRTRCLTRSSPRPNSQRACHRQARQPSPCSGSNRLLGGRVAITNRTSPISHVKGFCDVHHTGDDVR